MIESSDVMKKKSKRKSKLWEKIFIILSILIVIIIIGIYAYRTIYYYRKTNYTPPDAKLIDIVTNQMNVVYSGDGLYKENNTDNFYYYGKNPNNYLLYNGLLWRIISADSMGIKIIADSSLTSLVWGVNETYDKSNIYKWLNEDVYIKTIQNNILNSNWCSSTIDINDYKCNSVVSSKVGLITTEEYLKAGGVDSYLNNNTYFWTLNTSDELKAYYIHNEGGINNEVSSGTNFYSYGVRPVVYLNKEIPYLNGKGTESEPYIVENNQEIAINNHPVGSYVFYQGYTWKVTEITEKYTKVILDGYLMNEKGEPIKLSYNKVNTYLNDTFIKKLKTDNLVKIDFLITEYNNDSAYNYSTKKSSNSSYIGLPIISDLFITEYENVWLNTYANTNQKLIYTTSKESSLYADLETSENYIRPVIAIKNGLIIASGDGTKNNPFVLGDE